MSTVHFKNGTMGFLQISSWLKCYSLIWNLEISIDLIMKFLRINVINIPLSKRSTKVRKAALKLKI